MLSGLSLFIAAVLYTVLVFLTGVFVAKRNMTKILESTKTITEIAKNTVDTIDKIKQENK